jgi:hypothetical protein
MQSPLRQSPSPALYGWSFFAQHTNDRLAGNTFSGARPIFLCTPQCSVARCARLGVLGISTPNLPVSLGTLSSGVPLLERAVRVPLRRLGRPSKVFVWQACFGTQKLKRYCWLTEVHVVVKAVRSSSACPAEVVQLRFLFRRHCSCLVHWSSSRRLSHACFDSNTGDIRAEVLVE